MEQSQALKKILKKWEGEFVSKNQRKPKKSDIDVAPEHIQDAYNKYNQLKKQKLNESSSLDAWSDSLNRTSTKDPATKVNDTGNKPSAGYLEKLGAKLFQNAKCLPQKQSNSHRKLNSLGNTTPSADKGGNSTPPIQSDSPFAEGGTFGKALLLSQKKSKGASNLLAEPLIPEPFRMREKSQLLQKKFQRAASMKACGTDSEACVMSDDRKTGELFLDESGNEDSAERDVVWKNDECDLADFRPISGLSSRTQTSQKVPFGSSESRIVPHSLIGLDQLHDSEVKSKDTFNFEDDLEADMEISPSKNKENFCLQQSDTTKSRTSKTTKMKRKVGDAESDDYCPTSKRTKLSEDFSSFEKSETSDYQEAQLQSTQLKAASVRVTSSKPMKTDNFVRLNMKTKGYKRKGKGMTGAQHKRLLWKNKMAARSSSRGDTCFKCGETGHWANKCPNRAKKQPHKFNFGDNPKLKKKKEEEEAEEEEEADFDLDLQFDIDGNVLPTSYEAPTAPPPTEPLVPPNHDGSLQELDDLVSRGLKMFGFSSFRAGQEKAVKRILSGLSTLVVLSTGAGKSLCYQLPAYLYAQRSKCITLVISPLISLMEDQIAGLPKGVKGACFHSNMTKAQREKVMSALEDGSLHFLLISPETIAGGGGGATHGGLINPAKLPPIAFVCIDEAHCLSEWSHHFRPSYLRLCKVLRERFGVRCFLGLTATATLSTAADVSRHLNITDFKEATIRGQPVPDNLKLSVSRDEDRDDALIQLLQGERMSKCASIIIYCTRRDQTDRLATLIRTCLKDSALSRDVVEEYASQNRAQVKAKGKVKRKADNLTWDAESYHAGLTSAQRLRVQNAFMSGRLRVVVATVAFGMGLDKSDVRAVIHYNMPKSFESYVQEIGRAGRDGKPAHCHLFLDQQGHDLCELRKHTFANTIDRFTVKRLLQKVFLPCRCREIHHRAECDKQAADFPDDDIDYNKLGEDNSGSDETSKFEITPCSTTVSANCEKDCEKVSANRICPGHERAIPIEPTVMELDVKEEGLATLMCYLELRSDIVVENLPPVYATCRLQCYGGPRQLQTVAQKCPPVGVTVARLKRDGAFDRATKELEFNVVELADSMGWDSGPVKRELKTLMWDFSASGPTKSGVMVEFSDLAFHLRAPGDLSDNERDTVLDELSQRVVRQERTELRQLNQLHTALTSVSHKAYWMCSDEVDLKRDRRLKSVIDEYFENQKPPEELLTEEDSDPEVDAATLSQLQADIRGFVNTYSTDHSLTARAIARVLHGIASPRFPALVWGRVRRYWRSYLHVDFNVVMNVARQTLLQLRS